MIELAKYFPKIQNTFLHGLGQWTCALHNFLLLKKNSIRDAELAKNVEVRYIDTNFFIETDLAYHC